MPFRVAGVRGLLDPSAFARKCVVDASGESTCAAFADDAARHRMHEQAFATPDRMVSFGAASRGVGKSFVPRQLALGHDGTPTGFHERVAQHVVVIQPAHETFQFAAVDADADQASSLRQTRSTGLAAQRSDGASLSDASGPSTHTRAASSAPAWSR